MMSVRSKQGALAPPRSTSVSGRLTHRVARVLLRAAASANVDGTRLAAELGIPLTAGADARIDRRHLYTLALAIAEVSGDQAIGIHIGRAIRLQEFGVLGCMVQFSATLEDAFNRLCRFVPLAGEGLELTLRVQGAQARLQAVYPAQFTGTDLRIASEGLAATCLAVGRELIELDWTPIEASFQHPRPDCIESYERFFRCPLRFAAPQTGLAFDASLLEREPVCAEPRLCAVLEEYAEHALPAELQAMSIEGSVRRAILAALPDEPTIERVATALGSSPRTVQRRLADKDTSFRLIADQTRRDLAIRYVESSALPTSEIAYQLGYSTPGAFHRAFKRWTGRTPGQHRARLPS